jgi:hypothetical protein
MLVRASYFRSAPAIVLETVVIALYSANATAAVRMLEMYAYKNTPDTVVAGLTCVCMCEIFCILIVVP